jgi:hypothetical protein
VWPPVVTCAAGGYHVSAPAPRHTPHAPAHTHANTDMRMIKVVCGAIQHFDLPGATRDKGVWHARGVEGDVDLFHERDRKG